MTDETFTITLMVLLSVIVVLSGIAAILVCRALRKAREAIHLMDMMIYNNLPSMTPLPERIEE